MKMVMNGGTAHKREKEHKRAITQRVSFLLGRHVWKLLARLLVLPRMLLQVVKCILGRMLVRLFRIFFILLHDYRHPKCRVSFFHCLLVCQSFRTDFLSPVDTSLLSFLRLVFAHLN